RDLIGWFLDNELPWWGEFGWRADGQRTLLERFAAFPTGRATKEALRAFFVDRYHGDVAALAAAWGPGGASFEVVNGPGWLVADPRGGRADASAFAGVVAERFFAVLTAAVRKADPNHLILGTRFAGEAPPDVVEACGRHCDVVSVNHYSKSGEIDHAM